MRPGVGVGRGSQGGLALPYDMHTAKDVSCGLVRFWLHLHGTATACPRSDELWFRHNPETHGQLEAKVL